MGVAFLTLDRYFSASMVRLIRIALTSLALLHITACMFYVAADLTLYYNQMSWLHDEGVVDGNIMSQYSEALYWVRCPHPCADVLQRRD